MSEPLTDFDVVTDEHLDLLRRGYNAFATADLDTITPRHLVAADDHGVSEMLDLF